MEESSIEELENLEKVMLRVFEEKKMVLARSTGYTFKMGDHIIGKSIILCDDPDHFKDNINFYVAKVNLEVTDEWELIEISLVILLEMQKRGYIAIFPERYEKLMNSNANFKSHE